MSGVPDDGASATLRPGDLIFCRALKGDWIGGLVARLTHGPYCHVRVVTASGPGGVRVIEALPIGIVRTPLYLLPDPADVAPTGAHMATIGLAAGQRWLALQVGRGYGFADILDDIWQAILPRWLGSRTPFLVAPHTFDCSDLATRFLLHAGYYALPDAMVDDPTRVSPNDLARALGLIKS